jgi:hypothetical protein
MARRFRLGPVSSPTALAALAAAMLLAALVLTGRVLNPSSSRRPPAASSSARTAAANTQAPYRIGGKVDCPPSWPVLAMSNHASYPAGHPTRPPPSATAVACYQTTARAASAGYPPAPLPAGALEVGGVYLTPTSGGFQARCRRVADRLGFAVPCPGLLPTAPPGLPPPRLCQEPPTCRRGQVLRFVLDGFVVPFGYVGALGGSGTLGIVAMPTRGTPDQVALRCPSERPIATPTMHRTRAVLAVCPDDAPSILGGGVLVRWSEQGTVVEVTTLGSGEVNQRLVVALADHVGLVGPRR